MEELNFDTEDWMLIGEQYEVVVTKPAAEPSGHLKVYKYFDDDIARTILVKTEDLQDRIKLITDEDPFRGFITLE